MANPPIHISCRYCENHCILGTRENESSLILDFLLPTGWVPQIVPKTQGTEVHFTCPECEHPKLNKRPERPTHPPPPRRKT